MENERLKLLTKSLTYEDIIEIQLLKEREMWNEWGFQESLYPLFSNLNTKNGIIFEDLFITNTNGILPKPKGADHKSYDFLISQELVDKNGLVGNRLELKLIKALSTPKNSKGLSPIQRVKSSECAHTEGSFQQIKIAKADYGLFAIMYGDGVHFLWVPFNRLVNRLHTQHSGNLTEGQLQNKLSLQIEFHLEFPNTPALGNVLFDMILPA